MSLGGRSVDDWLAVYDEVRPTYRALVDKLFDLLEELLDAEDADYEWMYTWVMPRDRFDDRLYRALRTGESADDPFRDLPDFAGLTVIVSEVAEIEAVADVVERAFDVDHGASVSAEGAAARRAGIAETPPLGYEGVRYAIQITPARAQLPEWRPYAELRTQIEVQTVLQYAWERIDRSLPYYEGEAYPPRARLDLGDFEALIAAADRQHEQIWASLAEERARYQELVERGELDVELNGESLIAYLQSSETVAALAKAGREAGFREDPDPFEPGPTETEELTLWLLRRTEIHTLRELDDFLREAEGRADRILHDIASISTGRGFQPWALPDSIVQWLVLVLRRADPETIELMQYIDEIADSLNILIGNPVEKHED